MAHLIGQARLSARITVASYLTVLAGAALYWIDSQGFTSAWQILRAQASASGSARVAGLIGFGFGQMVGKNATAIGAGRRSDPGYPNP